ncbi:MAG: four helix bundle protein [Candidatus Magasanikbacteria bacterium]
MGNYKKLDIYQRSFRASIAIYKLSLELPKYLQYDIADDLRRAARSIPSNIAEGFGRNKSDKDKINFLRTSLGSNDEVLFNLEFIKELKLIDDERHNKATIEYNKIGSGIIHLIEAIN